MKLKIYTDYSPSHKILFDEFFNKTLPHHEFDLKVEVNPQECPSGAWYQQGWEETCIRKSRIVLEACRENMDGIFVFSDVDVQFFGNIKDLLLEELGDYDIACQNDTGDTYCAGFFICRCNERTLSLFENMLNKFEKDDQYCLNKYIHALGIKAKFLSNKFLTVGNVIHSTWDESYGHVNFPKDILVHHGNFTIGVNNKIKLMDMVRKQINK